MMVVCCAGFLVSLVLWISMMYLFPGNIILIIFPSILTGMFLSPTLTIGVELACEIGYPVGEAYSNGMIQIFGNITGIAFT